MVPHREVWSPNAMTMVELEAREVAFLDAIAAGATPREALDRSGLAPESDLEARAYLAFFERHALLPYSSGAGMAAPLSAGIGVRALGEVARMVLVARGLARSAASLLAASRAAFRARRLVAAAERHAAALDTDWSRPPRWIPHRQARPHVASAWAGGTRTAEEAPAPPGSSYPLT